MYCQMNKKKLHMQKAKQLLKTFQSSTKGNKFCKLCFLRGGVYYFKPVRKLGIKKWLTKHCTRPVVTKRTMQILCRLGFGDIYPIFKI